MRVMVVREGYVARPTMGSALRAQRGCPVSDNRKWRFCGLLRGGDEVGQETLSIQRDVVDRPRAIALIVLGSEDRLEEAGYGPNFEFRILSVHGDGHQRKARAHIEDLGAVPSPSRSGAAFV